MAILNSAEGGLVAYGPDGSQLPEGALTLITAIDAHRGRVTGVSWDSRGQVLASSGVDGTVALWDLDSLQPVRRYEHHRGCVNAVSFSRHSPDIFASAGDDARIVLRNARTNKLLNTFNDIGRVLSLCFGTNSSTVVTGGESGGAKVWHAGSHTPSRRFVHKIGTPIYSVAADLTGTLLSTSGLGRDVRLWDLKSAELRLTLEHPGTNSVWSTAFSPDGDVLATGAFDGSVHLWDIATGRLLRTLEGHAGAVDAIAFAADGQVMASRSTDGTIRLWNPEVWELMAIVHHASTVVWAPALALHSTPSLLAYASPADPKDPDATWRLHVVSLNLDMLRTVRRLHKSVHYVNAKVVLVGDTGVGKSGLSLVLNGQAFEATDSTPGRHVSTLDSREILLGKGLRQTREILLWDLAGQPGYRVIHQLHLHEVSVALVVFDARSETDPLSGVRHWERALRVAHHRAGQHSIPIRKFLVSARADRGGVTVSRERLDSVIREFEFDNYFETSAKEGWNVRTLRNAIEDAIPWESLPVVTSERLFASMRQFLLDMKKTGRLLAPVVDLLTEVSHRYPHPEASSESTQSQLDTCIGRLENRDLLRRLTFGGYVLLQPELLDAYGSAIVNAAKNEPDGLGSIAEDVALGGHFYVPPEQKITDQGQEQLLLHATVEELVRHDLALRESADDGRYLVFPSQFNRDYEDAPEPKGTRLAITFEGPVQTIYSTLAVRLGHSGLFVTGRAEMWRNAAVFTARAGGRCGIYVREFSEARGQVLLFFDDTVSAETQFHFEEFIAAHLKRRGVEGSISMSQVVVCRACDTPVPSVYVQMQLDRGRLHFDCPCGASVPLLDNSGKARDFTSRVAAMERAADRRRDEEARFVSARGETHTRNFLEWAGGDRVTLAIVFTDIVDSTALENRIGEERMADVRGCHFAQGAKLVAMNKGWLIKTIGDSIMAAFRSVDQAFDFAVAFQNAPGHSYVEIRAGLHVGAMRVEEGDVFGGTVAFASRVVGSCKGAEVRVSELAKADIDALRAKRHEVVIWKRHDRILMKGFAGEFTLWSASISRTRT